MKRFTLTFDRVDATRIELVAERCKMTPKEWMEVVIADRAARGFLAMLKRQNASSRRRPRARR